MVLHKDSEGPQKIQSASPANGFPASYKKIYPAFAPFLSIPQSNEMFFAGLVTDASSILSP